MTDPLDRRTVLRATGVTLAASALAGCSGGGETETDEPAGTDSPTGSNGGDGGDGSDSDGDGEGGNGGNNDDAPSFDGWLSNTDNYDGVVDETGADAVTVAVGVRANGGALGFGPAAVRVSPGTTVTWEWTGDGGQHNVVAEDGSFESDYYGDAGATFEHSFEEPGTYEYACTPHRNQGMKGVVVVE